jgi:homocysteine S-methyltransferase
LASDPTTALRTRLSQGGVLLLDGPTGTELERRGAPMDQAAWCGPASLDQYALLQRIHADYIRLGCDIVTANTYASSRLMLEPAGYGDRVAEIAAAAVRAARAARAEAAEGRPVLVAGSLSHMIPVQPGTGRTDEAASADPQAWRAAFEELAGLHAEHGCDAILLEMMYHPDRAALAIEAARASGLPVWLGFSARRGADGRVLSYYPHDDVPFERLLELIPDDVEAVGVMHSDANVTGDALDMVRAHSDAPLMAYPDSGHFEMPRWNFEAVMPPQTFRAYARDWLDRGARVLGGCCGLSMDHMRAIADLKR